MFFHHNGVWCVLVTAKDSWPAARLTLPAPPSRPRAAGPGPAPAARPTFTIRQTALAPRPPGRTIHRGIPASKMPSPTTKSQSLSYASPEPRLLVPDPRAPPELAHPRPLAPLPRSLGHRRSRTSLGYISTPLIWQGRKRPTRGGHPTGAPPKQVHITKATESPEAQNRVRLTTQGRAAYTPHMLAYVKHAAQPASHQPVPERETSTTPPKPELPPELRFSGSSQGALPWQRDEEAVDSPSVVGAAPLAPLSSSGISNRKKKPAALQWLQLSSASRGSQTLGNWTDPLEPLGREFSSGSEPVPDDLTDLGLYEFDTPPSTVSPTKADSGTERQTSLHRSDPLGVAQTRFSDHVETLGSEHSVPHTHNRLVPETAATRSHIPTLTVSQTNGRAGDETSATTQKWEASTSRPPPFLLMLPVSSLLFIQPSTSVPILQHPSSGLSAEETFVRQLVAQVSSHSVNTVSRDVTRPPFLYPNTSPPSLHKTSNRSAVPLQLHHHSSSSSCSSLPLRSALPSFVPSAPVMLPPSSSPPLHPSDSSPHACSATPPLPFSLQKTPGAGVFQPSVMSPLFSKRQTDFVDMASSSSLPLFSKVPTEPQMAVVDGVFVPERLAVSAEAEALSGQVMCLKAPPLCGARSVPSDGVVLNGFSPTEPGPSVETLPFSTEVRAPHLSPHVEPALSQVELLGPESGLSGVLWPSSVSRFLAHSGQRRLTDALPDKLRPPDFTSPTAAGPRVIERTPTLLHVNSDRMLPVGSHHPPNLLSVSTGSLPVVTVIPEQMAAAAGAAVFSSLLSPHPVVQAQTPSSGSHDSLTFFRDLPEQQQTVHSQVNRSSTSSGDGPSAVMAATQMLALSSTKPPQRASGLDYTASPPPADGEPLGHVTHTDSSAHTQTHTHSGAHTPLITSQKFNVSRRAGPDAEAGAGTRRPQNLPEGLSPPRSPAPSLPVTLTPSPDITASPPLFSSLLTHSLSPLLSAQLTLPAASANIDRSGISGPTNRRPTTLPVLESVHRLVPSAQASTLSDEMFNSTHNPPAPANQSEQDEDLLQFATSSQTADTSGSSSGAEAAVAGRQSALFDPAHVVPKIHVAVELEASAAASACDDVTLDADLFPVEPLRPTSEPSYHQTTAAPVLASALHSSGLNIPSSPAGSSAEAPGQGLISGLEGLQRPASAAGFKHISTSTAASLITLKDPETTNSTKTGSAPVPSAPGQMEAPQGSGTGGEPAPGLDVDADTSAVNVTVSTLPSNSGPKVSDPGGSPSSGASGLKDAHHVTATNSSSSLTAPPKAVSTSASGSVKPRPAPGSPAVGLTARPPLPCQCKQRFHFTCLCGLSSGNSMSHSNTPVDVENQNQSFVQSAACTVKNHLKS